MSEVIIVKLLFKKKGKFIINNLKKICEKHHATIEITEDLRLPKNIMPLIPPYLKDEDKATLSKGGAFPIHSFEQLDIERPPDAFGVIKTKDKKTAHIILDEINRYITEN